MYNIIFYQKFIVADIFAKLKIKTMKKDSYLSYDNHQHVLPGQFIPAKC